MDTSNVYWTEVAGSISGKIYLPNASIKKVGKAGGSVTTLATGIYFAEPIAVDAISVYWIEKDGAGIGSIKKVGVNGGVVTTLASGLSDPRGMVIDNTSVYWINSCPVGATTASVNKVGLNGGPTTALATGLPFLNAIAIDPL